MTECSWRDNQVLVVARVTDQRASLRVAWQVRPGHDDVLGDRVPEQEEEPGLARGADLAHLIVEVRLVGRSATVDAVQVETRRAEVGQRVRVVLPVERRHRVERQVVVDELSEIRVPGRNWLGRLLGIDLSLRCDLLLGFGDHRAAQREQVTLGLGEHRQPAEHAPEAALEERRARHRHQAPRLRAVAPRCRTRGGRYHRRHRADAVAARVRGVVQRHGHLSKEF